MIKSTLKLFNAIQVEKKTPAKELLLEKTVPFGFVLSPEVAGVVDDEIIKEISKYYLSIKKANQSFHKSWKTIKDTPQEVLWMQAIVHYFTTYGYEALGIDGEVYIPAEDLDLPDGIKLIVVKGMTKKEIEDAIIKLGSGVALSQDTLDAIMEIVEHNQFRIEDKVQNRELKTLLYDLYNIVPEKPVEFLRFVIAKLTGESLLIKNTYLIEKIKACTSRLHHRTLDGYLEQAPSNLAEIFFRYKPLFLALKSISHNKTFFNQLRKKANTMHKPLPEDYLNSITRRIKQDESLSYLEKKLETASIWRKIRLANALKYRMSNPTSIVYKIRNGRSWSDDFIFYHKDSLEKAYKQVVKSMKINKTVYIPEHVSYSVPATEKQFVGNFPANTSVQVEDNLIVGIYWKNVKSNRIDLDLSAVGTGGKVGWDSFYTSSDQKVLFSGDMTDAKNGASESIYIAHSNIKAMILMVNYYNYDKEIPVEAKIFVAHEKPENFKSNYTANNIIMQADITIKHKQSFVGLIYGNKFYFNHSAIGNSITSGEHSKKTREYLIHSCLNSLRLQDIVKVTSNDKHEHNLSPEKIDKNSILNILKGEK